MRPSCVALKKCSKVLISVPTSLAFYRRIFPIAQLRMVLIGVTAVVLCFTVSFLFIVIFQWYAGLLKFMS